MADDDDDLDFTSTQKSSRNLGSLFGTGESAPLPSVANTAYVPPKQPKKDSAPRVMIATVIQAFFYGADQKWTPKGKMGAALLSTDNTIFHLILYLTKTQQITSLRLSTNTVFTPQSNNYLSFQDDTAQNWSIMFDTKQGLADFALQIVLAKAYLSAFKFDHIIQDIREGEGSNFAEHETIEILLNTYKLLENGTIQSTDSGETKPTKYKVGKNQNGKTFDDIVRTMKKNGQRVAIIGATLYNIEVTRVKRDKERSSSINVQNEDVPTVVETKRSAVEEQETPEKSRLLQRIIREGGQQMFIQPNQSSAFVTPYPMQQSDDDSISVDFQQNTMQTRTISTPVPPVQFVQPGYHHPMHPQALIQQPNLYPQQQQPPPSQIFNPQTQQLHNYANRPNSSMGYPQMSMYPHSQYPGAPPNVPPTDMYYQQAQTHYQDPNLQNDLRPILNRISDKVDALNDKFDSKNSTSYPNMETSILLSNIQRIIKENETVKKDLFDRSAKVEELNLKISDLLDRNQRLIEQSHQTAEQRNVVVNNVSEQSAQKILDLEKQKVELTNNLSLSTSKIADLQLQLNQFNQNHNENQNKMMSLSQTCEQLREDLQKSEIQKVEFQNQYENAREQYKNEKQTRKQAQADLNSLQEELNELRMNYTNLEKTTNERKTKFDNERKRWQNEADEQKQSYESELEELRNKLRKQRAADNANNSQEISRIEQELQQEWQDKFDKQQVQYEKLLSTKVKEFEQLKSSFDENQTELQQTTEQLNESKQQIEEYVERCEKLQERCQLMKEKILEMNDEQPQIVNEQIKRAINIIFQQLKSRIQPTKQYSGETFLDKALEIIKKATLKVLSNDEEDEDDEDDEEEEKEEEEVEEEEVPEKTQESIETNSADQQPLNEEIPTVDENNLRKSSDSETSTNNQKNGWDTVDDFQQDSNLLNQEQEQNQIVVLEQQSNENTPAQETTVVQSETNVETTSVEQTAEQGHETDNSADTIEEDQPVPVETTPQQEQQTEIKESDDDDDDEMFKSARPSVQDNRSSQGSIASKPSFNRNIPLLTNPDDSDDELFK